MADLLKDHITERRAPHMKTFVRAAIIACLFCLVAGCTSKLVKIDSSPEFADIWINNHFAGRTPLYHKFTDAWYPWPIKKTDDYVVKARLQGYETETRTFLESPTPLDISYIPNEIFFNLRPIFDKDIIK